MSAPFVLTPSPCIHAELSACLAYYTRAHAHSTDVTEQRAYALVLAAARWLKRPPTLTELHQYWRLHEQGAVLPHPAIILGNSPIWPR